MFLDHLQLAMPPGGEPQAVKYFTALIKMCEVQKPQPLQARGGCWFSCGKVHLHIGVDEPFTPQKKAHPAFVADQLDALASRLVDAGYPVCWDESIPGRKRFYTDDPFGNRIEFMNEGDGFSQR